MNPLEVVTAYVLLSSIFVSFWKLQKQCRE